MATLAINADNAALVWGGAWDRGFKWSLNTECMICQGLYSQIAFTATGTALTINYDVAGTVVLKASVDGGAEATLTNGSVNEFTSVTVFTGLDDVAHTVVIRVTGATVANLFLAFTNVLTVTGAAPAFAAPTGTGPVYPASALRGLGGVDGLWCYQQNPIFSPGYSYPAILATSSVSVWPCTDSQVRFRSNATSLKLFLYRPATGAGSIKVFQDGTAVGGVLACPTVGGADMNWWEFVAGLDGAYHNYTVVVVGNVGCYLVNIMTVGGVIDFATTYPRNRGAIGGIGDSITVGTSGTSGDSTLSFLYKLAVAKNRPSYNGGVGSAYLCSGIVGQVGTSMRYTDITHGSPTTTFDFVVCLIGVNDIALSSNPPPTTGFQACYQNMLQGIRRNVGPSCKILALGILDTSNAKAGPLRDTYNGLISAAVTAMSDANTSYVDTDDWITPATDCTDGIHPTSAGYDKIVTELSPLITTWQADTDPGKANVATGNDYVFGGVSQTAAYPTTATSKAEQLQDDKDAITAGKADILDTRTILTIQGTYDLAAEQAAQFAAGQADQLATDQAAVEAVAGSIYDGVTNLLGTVDGTLTAASIAAEVWAYENRTVTA
jgi:lysophospholipase L1-like esterase